MLTIKYQTAFKKDYKRIVRRGYDVRLLEEVISILAEQKPLPEIYRDHNPVSYTHLTLPTICSV